MGIAVERPMRRDAMPLAELARVPHVMAMMSTGQSTTYDAGRPRKAASAHGPIIDDPQRVLRNYIDHRLEREQQILDALALGDSTPDEIAARVYRGLREQLMPMAKEGVVAHLRKLEREHRVRRTGDSWQRAGVTG